MPLEKLEANHPLTTLFCYLFFYDTMPACDRQTDVRTDRRIFCSCYLATAQTDMLTRDSDVSVPDGVQSLRVIGRGSYHVTLRWAVPMERNGILTGYIVGYRRGQRPSHVDFYHHHHHHHHHPTSSIEIPNCPTK